MQRCKESAGRFKISLRIANVRERTRVQVLGHRDIVAHHPDGSAMTGPDGSPILIEAAPVVGNLEPYEGELCVHELQWLAGVPGKDWRPEYEWTIERLDDATNGRAPQ